MYYNYQQQRLKNMQACGKELIGQVFDELFKFAPPKIQNLYNYLNYNKALLSLQDQSSLPIEKMSAVKTIMEIEQKYSQNK